LTLTEQDAHRTASATEDPALRWLLHHRTNVSGMAPSFSRPDSQDGDASQLYTLLRRIFGADGRGVARQAGPPAARRSYKTVAIGGYLYGLVSGARRLASPECR
jgi:hypothetical protein